MLLLWLWPVLIYGLENWPSLAVDTQLAIRTQRDISYDVPINQITDYGVSLKGILFNTKGYTTLSLPFISNFLNTGLNTMVIDLYWNNLTHLWQLCPAPYPINMTDATQTVKLNWEGRRYECSSTFTVDSIMQSIYSHLISTNTNMNVNFMKLLYRLHKINIPSNATAFYQKSSSYGNATLSDAVHSLGGTLYLPSDAQSYRTNLATAVNHKSFYNSTDWGFPNLQTFFYTDLKRIMVMVVHDEVTHTGVYNYTVNDENSIFIKGKSVNVTLDSIDSSAADECISNVFNLSSVDPELFRKTALSNGFRYVYDIGNMSFNDVTYKSLIRCGFSPILNTSFHMPNKESIGTIMNRFIPLSFWSWSSNLTQALEDLMSSNSSFARRHSDTKSPSPAVNQEANNCVSIWEQGWKIENCYKSLPYACQSNTDPIDWKIGNHARQYFDVYKASSCPQGYAIGAPKLSIEMIALLAAISRTDTKFPLWIDVNDITVKGCFVKGGPYAKCPYQDIVSEKVLAGLIAPSFVTIIVMIILFLMEKLWRVNPIQTERKRYWKRKINEFNKEVYEGVPS